MIKVTGLYGHRQNSLEFEWYDSEKHLSLAAKMKIVVRLERTRFGAGPDGGKPPSLILRPSQRAA